VSAAGTVPHDGHIDPRVLRSREAVLTAAVDLLAEHGVSGVTVEAIAHRSGVAKTTIYRHWPESSQLVLDAIRGLAEPCAAPDTGTLRGDLTAIIEGMADNITTSALARVLPSLIDAADRDEAMADVQRVWVRERRTSLRHALHRAEVRGEIPPRVDADLVASLCGGSLFYRRLVSHEPLNAAFLAGVIDSTLLMVGAVQE
jgi:AcrR family transcriptional regulator